MRELDSSDVLLPPTTSAVLAQSNTSMPPSRETTKQQPQQPQKQYVLQWREAVAGAAAGAFAKTAVAPIERLKLLLQLQGSLQLDDKSSTRRQPPRTAYQLARTVYQEQGLLSFWRGNMANVLQQAGTVGLNFMLMDYYKYAAVSPLLVKTLEWPSRRSPENRKRRRQLWSSFISGGLAGGTATTVLYPIQFLRTRLAMDMGSTSAGEAQRNTRIYPRGMRDVFCSIYNVDGIRGLYQGYGISVTGVILYRALHLGGYDAVKTELVHFKQRQTDSNSTDDGHAPTLSWAERFAVAQGVSLTAGTMCYPIDSVRRRLMMQAGAPLQDRRYRHSLDCFKQVFQQEGIRGFYLGLGPNLVRSLGAALLLVAYDVFKVML